MIREGRPCNKNHRHLRLPVRFRHRNRQSAGSRPGNRPKDAIGELFSASELEVSDGRDWDKAPSTLRFKPRRFPYGSIIVDGHSGYISLQGFHWLSRNKVPVFILNFDGSLISSILPPAPIKADLRAAQIRASADPEKKIAIAKAIVQAKIARSLQVLDWLAQRYDIEKQVSRQQTTRSHFSA